MDQERIFRALHDELNAAKQRWDAASLRFQEAIAWTLGGLQQPDNEEIIQRAYQEYTKARHEVTDAMVRLREYLLHGTIPPDLQTERKPAGTETPKPPGEKTG